MNVPTEKIIRATFLAICLFGTVYMVLIQFFRFMENEDVSASNFRRLNGSPRDLYPTYSICLKDNEGSIFVNEKLSSLFGLKEMDGKAYALILSGTEVSDSLKNVTQIAYAADTFTNGSINLKDYSKYLKSKYRLENRAMIIEEFGNEELLSTDTDKNEDRPLFLSLQNSKQVCYSQVSVYRQKVEQVKSTLKLNASILGTNQDHARLDLKIFVHYPNQLFRQLDKPLVVAPMSYFIRDEQEGFNDFRYTIVISHVSTLRRRSDAKIPCDPDLENDDETVRNVIMKKVGCVPPYWFKLQSNRSSLPMCNTSSQMKEIYEYQCHSFEFCPELLEVNGYENAFDVYLPPCSEMSVVAMPTLIEQYTKSVEGALVEINFVFMADTYTEIVNSRGFTFESFFSGVGGFIGIFIGYSLLSFADMFISFINYLTKFCCEKKHNEK